MSKADREAACAALAAWPALETAAVAPFGRGLINQSFLVESAGGRFVLQRLSPIFDPAIHRNIARVTRRLTGAGMDTPSLVPTAAGRLWHDGSGGAWRLYRHIDGVTLPRLANAEQARSAGRLVGRFHAAIAGLTDFTGARLGVHDTARHMAELERAIAEHRDHRLAREVAELGGAILAAYAASAPLAPLPLCPGHGDLKLDNVVFAADAAEARCLIDLDTLGPIHLAHELGDMWRSWCNLAGESADPDRAEIDLGVLAHSWQGYLDGIGRAPSGAERAAALAGLEIISLELAARFCADALCERYFGWDRARFAGAGEHNLVRARSQHALHRAAVRCRQERRAIVFGE